MKWIELSFVYGVPVKQLQRQLSSEEFTELIAYDLIEAWPNGWKQTGTLAAVMAALHGDKKTARMKPDDFIPKRREPKRQTIAEMKAVMKAVAARSRRNQ